MASTSDPSFGNTPIDAATVGSANTPGISPGSDNDRAIDPGVLADVKAILRDSLRLGPTAPMDDDMALVGGTIDLDSIDILLVVSNLEKHFKIKIPNEAVGRSAFTSVATLAKYVSDNRELLKVAPATPGSGVPQAPGDYLARLPHGPEFTYVSAVTDVAPGKAAAGYWNVTGAEPFFAGHFPGRPIVPGVLITEALAQIAGIASVEASPGAAEMAVLAAVDVRFFAPVIPPASIELRAERTGGEGPFVRCAVTASVGGRAVAGGSVELKLGGVGVSPVGASPVGG